MKRTILIGALLSVPFLALAHDKSAAMSGENATPAQIVTKLHSKSKLHVELGNLAQSQAISSKVKALGEQIVKDHNKFDADVMAYAGDQKIVLSEAEIQPAPQTGAAGVFHEANRQAAEELKQMGKDISKAGQEVGEKIRGSKDQPTTTGKLETPPESEKEAYKDQPKDEAKMMQDRARAEIDRLRGLSGATFDREFLTDISDSSNRMVNYLESAKKNVSDRKLKGLIDRGVKMYRNENRDAQKLIGVPPSTT